MAAFCRSYARSGVGNQQGSTMSQKFIPAVFMRGGSSKGVVFHARDLPDGGQPRDRLFLDVLGTPDPYGRQLNGMGGGISSLSKVAIIGPPTHPDADVD
jgi:2-methylaconitate isomerase